MARRRAQAGEDAFTPLHTADGALCRWCGTACVDGYATTGMTICATCASTRRVKVVRLLTNPYLEEARQRFEQDDERERARLRLYEAGDVDALRAFALHQPSMHRLRDELRSRYAWAIPNEQALAVLAKRAPLVEIGAGTG